jgi:hypothetical protein
LRDQLYKARRQLADREQRTKELIDAVYRAARDGAAAQPKLPRPPKVTVKAGTSPHVALLHTTDWQCGKVTADFDMEILEARLDHMMDVTARLNARHGNPVTRGVILLGGDMIEGISIFPTQPFEVNAGLYDQVFTVVRLIRKIIDRALNLWPEVHVVAKWGNHGRIGRFGELPDPDNLDRMAYRIAWERYQDDQRVTWDVDSLEYVQQFEIGNYHAALLHGNEFHKTFSAERITRKITAWQTMYGFGDVYMGHFHRRDCYGLPNGTMAYLTASPESSNAYAADQLAAQTVPSQRLHFIDPERGNVNSEHLIWVA